MNRTIFLNNKPKIHSYAAIGGPMEGAGPLGNDFDLIVADELWETKSWEKAESKFISETYKKILENGQLSSSSIDCIFAGDLLNQSIATSFGFRNSKTPYFGVYGACSTIAESMCIGSIFVDSGYMQKIICITSSHFCSAEKQFRFPLQFGNQRPPTAQWTVTASGGVCISSEGEGPSINSITPGIIIDKGIKDANNMGAAMAPAAADTLISFFNDNNISPEEFDLIVTGDLGKVGSDICRELCEKNNIILGNKYSDCGLLIYDRNKQDVHCGGSGCGCCASVLASYIIPKMKDGSFNRVLIAATGALLSTTSLEQRDSIPSISHAVELMNI